LDKSSQNGNLEESIFKTLSHSTRRDILRFIGEQKHASFTQIKNNVKVEDSASLSYHISALQPLVVQKDGKYVLTDLGQDAYALINKATVYSESNSTLAFLRSRFPWVIVVNAVLWAAALLLATVFEKSGQWFYAIASFAALWYVSNLILSRLLARLGGKPCFKF